MSSGQSRDYVLVYVNGQEHRVRDELAFMQLADYLRYEQGLYGTKIVCAEGDCGACSVLIGRKNEAGRLEYKPLNSCIQAMYQLDLAHVITVEGLTPGDSLSPIQQAMVDCHGAQCGFCTPGFIVSLAALFDKSAEQDSPLCRQSVKGALSGNLCRCTGYESIIKSALATQTKDVLPVESQYASGEILQAFDKHANVDVRIETAAAAVFIPQDISAAVQFKRANEGTVIVSGGTDVCVNINKRGLKPRNILSTCNLRGLKELTIEGGQLIVGARVTLEELADFVKDSVPEFYKILWVFGAPQIRYAGTLAGNIANGSPIGDTLPFLFAMEAAVEVTGVHGARKIPICSLYKGYKTMDVTSDEIITRIMIPLPTPSETLRLFKVSKREHLDISSLAAAVLISCDAGSRQSSRIRSARVAFGGVGPTVMRLPLTESYLQGKELKFATFEEAGAIAVSEITPISDVRGSSDFRKQLAENIFLKFYFSLEAPEPALTL